MTLLVISLWTVAEVVIGAGGQSINDTKALMEDLFVNRNYNKEIRPVNNQSNALLVTIGFGMINLNYLDVTSGHISLFGYIDMHWKDEQLTWDPVAFGGITQIPLADERIWLPQIAQYTHVAEKASLKTAVSKASLQADGKVYWVSLNSFITYCKIDILLYPFDRHVCDFLFLSSSYYSRDLILQTDSVEIKKFPLLVEHGEWDIEKTACRAGLFSESEVSSTTSFLNCTMVIVRQPVFGLQHVIMPVICLNILTLPVFWIAVNSGERISYAVTLFLSYVVTLTGLTDEMPRNSRKMALFSYLLGCMSGTSVICVVMSIVVTRLALKPADTIPPFLEKVTLIVHRRKRSTVHPANDAKIDDIDQGETQTKVEPFAQEEIVGEPDDITWLMVAEAIDKLMFLFVLTVLTVTVAIGVICGIVFDKEVNI